MARKDIRELTTAERRAIAPDIDRLIKAECDRNECLDRLNRMLALMEPDPDVLFDMNRLVFYREDNQSDSGAP